jgi:CrcB protein
MLALGVAVAAGLGAVARYVVDETVTHRTRTRFPAGTFVVNVTGSFLLGVVTGLAVHHGLSRQATVLVGTGLAGGYTTFSTWAWESVALTETGSRGLAVGNVLGSLAAGMAAAAAGLGVALL